MNYSPTLHDTHTCPGGCGTPVVRNLFACRACWRRLPLGYQTPIHTARWADDHAAHSRAMSDAMMWYRADAEERALVAIIRERG